MNQPYMFHLDLQKFLRSFGTIATGNEALGEKFAVNIKEDFLEHGDDTIEPVWIYNYDQFKAKGLSRIENEARGLILNAEAKVVSMAFQRFFNHVEPAAAELEWKTTNAEFKHDGTLITIYSYRGDYFISTRGSAMADGQVSFDLKTTFYKKVFDFLTRKFPDDPFGPFKKHNDSEKYVWVFEYVGPYNRIVTPYKDEDLILIAAFNKLLCREVLPEYVDQFAAEHDFERPPFKGVRSMDDVNRLISKMDPLEEGFVLVDRRFHRVKVKNPAYLSVSKMVAAGSTPTPRHMAEIVLKGDGAEIGSYFPEYCEILEYIEEVVRYVIRDINETWIKFRFAPDKKTFAENVKRHRFSNILFLAWDGDVKDMSDALKYIKPKQLIDLVDEYHNNGQIKMFSEGAP